MLTLLLAAGALAAACQGFIGEAGQPPGGGGPSTTGTGGTGGPGPNMPGPCTGDVIPYSKRLVRLSFNQVSVSVHQIFGDTLGQQVDSTALIGPFSAVPRTFPPLAAGQEGGTVIQRHWQTLDSIASSIGAYTLANLGAVATSLGVGAAPTTDAAAQTFITALATKAFRRPPNASETASLMQVYTEVKAQYTTIPEAIQHTVYAIMQSPQFVYRTEIGTDRAAAGALTDYELASQLSYFLTDGPPDAPLMAAAAAGRLTDPGELGNQTTRILGTPAARTNLGAAMFSYFALDALTSVRIMDPGWTAGTPTNPYSGVRESSYREAELFLTNNLWGGPLAGLVNSRESRINNALAPIYGVTIPATATRDADGFALVNLPENRAGILTQVSFLAARSRPDIPSVVGRGLAVNDALLCAINPPFPEDPATLGKIADAKVLLATASERERADYRGKTSPCGGCHLNFDAYGLALEKYDIIGRYRENDPEGRPIDPSVTLPPNVGGTASGAVDMANKVAASPGFTACITKNMINWALAEGSQLTSRSCSTEAVTKTFDMTDKSFSSLLREIAVSEAFMKRTAGVN